MASTIEELRKQQMMERAGVRPQMPGLVQQAQRTAFPTNLPESGYLKNRPAPPSITQGLASKAAQVFPSTAMAIQGRRDDIADAQRQGGISAAVGQSLRTAAVPLIGLADDTSRGLSALISPAAQAVKTFATGDPTPIGQEQPRQVAQTQRTAQAPQPVTVAPAVQSLRAEQEAQPKVMTPATNPLVRQIAPGVFRQGNTYGDSEEATNMAGGRVSQQNMQAAENLAQRSAARMAQPEQPMAQVEQPRLSGSGFGLLDRGYQERRAAMMDAQQLKPGARTALASLLQRQAQEPQIDLARDRMEAEQESGAADRGLRQQELIARMGEAEATRALRAQELGDNMQTNAVRREAAQMEVEAARELQGLRSQFMAAKTDKERNEIATKIQALQGKVQEQQNRFTVVPGGQEIAMVGGMPTPITRPSMVFNNQTGQFVEQAGGQQALPPITQNPRAMEIKNDPKMTIEQKRAALMQLGYQ